MCKIVYHRLDQGALSVHMIGLIVGVVLIGSVVLHSMMSHVHDDSHEHYTSELQSVPPRISESPTPSVPPYYAGSSAKQVAVEVSVDTLDFVLAVDRSRVVCKYADLISNASVHCPSPHSSFNKEKMCNTKCWADEGCCLEYEYCVSCCTDDSFDRCRMACRVAFHRHGAVKYCWKRTRQQPS